MAPSSPNVSAPSSASTLPTTQTSSATPRSLPDCRNTAPGTRKMPEPIVVPTTMSTRSRSVRTRRSSAGTCNSVRTTSSAEPRLCGGEGVDQAGEVKAQRVLLFSHLLHFQPLTNLGSQHRRGLVHDVLAQPDSGFIQVRLGDIPQDLYLCLAKPVRHRLVGRAVVVPIVWTDSCGRLSCVPLAYELVLRIEERAIEWPMLVEAVAKVRDRSAQVAIGFAVGKVRVLYQLDPPDTGCDLEQVPEDLRVSAEGGHGLANLRGGVGRVKVLSPQALRPSAQPTAHLLPLLPLLSSSPSRRYRASARY